MNMFNRQINGLAKALLLSTVLFTAACASIPDLGPAPEAKEAQAYVATQSFQAPTAEWPASTWWTGYGDAQLNALIAEALAGAPSLAQAEARLRQAEGIAQQAGAARLPQVSADASAALVKQSSNNGVPSAFVPKGWNDTGRAKSQLRLRVRFLGQEPRVARRGDLGSRSRSRRCRTGPGSRSRPRWRPPMPISSSFMPRAPQRSALSKSGRARPS